MKMTFLYFLILTLPLSVFAQKNTDSTSREGQQKAEAMPPPKAEAAPKVSASYKAKVKKLMEVTNMADNQQAVIERLADSLVKDAKDPIKAKKATVDYFKDVLSIDALLDDVAQVYSKHFSESEVKKLVDFYQSPLGKKAATKMPEVNRDMMMIGQIKAQVRMETFKKDKEKMEGFK